MGLVLYNAYRAVVLGRAYPRRHSLLKVYMWMDKRWGRPMTLSLLNGYSAYVG